jgi:FkbM family methyltransferase
MLHRVDPNTRGAFIDCGANVGELGAFCKARGLDYHPFEPEQLEADCCDRNNFDGQKKTNRLALWNEETTLKFYSKPDNGDSSVIEPDQFTSVKEVPTTTVDSYCRKNGIKEIAVLKIEAEGAEPEILSGAKEALGFSSYVTVDCGFERGVSKASTVVEVVNILTQNGFELVDWDPGRVTFLFRNRLRTST